jgi:hypothetical protein
MRERLLNSATLARVDSNQTLSKEYLRKDVNRQANERKDNRKILLFPRAAMPEFR